MSRTYSAPNSTNKISTSETFFRKIQYEKSDFKSQTFKIPEILGKGIVCKWKAQIIAHSQKLYQTYSTKNDYSQIANSELEQIQNLNYYSSIDYLSILNRFLDEVRAKNSQYQNIRDCFESIRTNKIVRKF